ncbi:MAG: glycosyltransferase [Planctomycetota bacterium]|jgi:glycosyltransferase involved in cell wall biosynthesis
MNDKPKISVITASKNGARFLCETIESVLKQSFTNYEHVLVDGASTDETIEILKEYKHIRWISEPDRDADEGFYKAMTMARGEYIMLCFVSDGYLDRDWFERCVEVLENDAEVSMVYGLTQQMSEDGRLGKIASSNFLNHPPPQKMDFPPFWLGTFRLCPESTLCIRTNVFKECFPKYEPTGNFLQNHAILSFSYNFITKGYLPYFLPVVASYGRYHHDANTIKFAERDRVMKKQYQAAIIRYGNEVLSGSKKHVFRDGKSNVIKAIEPDELKLYRQKVLDYRINLKAYVGKRGARRLSYWIRKFKILSGYHLGGQRIYN